MSLDTLAASIPAVEVTEQPTIQPTDQPADLSLDTPATGSLINDEPINQPTDQPTAERPDWLQDKYVTDGRSMEESISEQAKGYKEMFSKFSSFTGAPESYGEFSFSEELTATMESKGVSLLSADDPLMKGMGEIAKELNMSQDGYNQFAEAFVSNQMAQEDARVAGVVEALGENAAGRIKEIQQWQTSLPDEVKELTNAVATNAEGIELLEYFMGLGNKAPAMERTPSKEAVVADPQAELYSLMSDKRYQTDAGYRKEVDQRAKVLFPS